ncbi:MAG: hypothetical protein LBV51_02260 [Acholeplasmatales bacterium]|jgi:hypothetical protein|nr:hypothetical protein [Acholeplasmatales bacterium]
MKKILLLILALVTSIVLVSCKYEKDVLATALSNVQIIYAQGDRSDSVTKNVTLPTSTKVLKKEVSYSWESSVPSALSALGVVTRPFSSSDTSLVLTLTASYEDAAKTKVFPITVKKVDIVSALNIGYAAGDHALSVSKDVTLPSTVQASGYTAQVQWVSSNVGVITSSGAVIHYFGDDTIVRLTATASGSEGQSITKSFDLTVLGYNVDLAIGYAPLENSQNVKHNVTLPSSVSASGISASVTWSSSNASVVSASGVVSRPFGDATSVTLSATITTPASSTTKIYVVSVIGIPISLVTESAAIEQSVTSNINLPISATIDTVNISYTWETSNSGVIDKTGKVTRQAQDTIVTLTYTAHNGVHTYSVAFDVTVIHFGSEDEYSFFPYEELEYRTGFDLSTLPDPSWIGYYIYSAYEDVADVELSFMLPSEYESFILDYYQALEEAGYTYIQLHNYYLSPDESYTVKLYDFYVTNGTYDLLLQKYTHPDTITSWEEVEEYISEQTGNDWIDALYHDETVTSFEISIDGNVGYFIVLLGLESLDSYKAGLEEKGYFFNSSYVSENSALYQVADGEYCYNILVGVTSTQVYLDVWVSFNILTWENITNVLENYTGLDLSDLVDPNLPNYVIYSVDEEQADVGLTITYPNWVSFVTSYYEALLEAGFTYNEDGAYYISPSNTYTVYLEDVLALGVVFDLFIQKYISPVTYSFPYDTLESILGVTLKGLLPNIFDNVEYYNVYNGVDSIFDTAVSKYVDIFDGPLDTSVTLEAYEAGLIQNGFTFYGFGAVYEDTSSIYAIILDSVTLYVGVLYSDLYGCYTITFWVVENGVTPPQVSAQWLSIIEQIEQSTPYSLSILPDANWEDAYVYTVSSNYADVELKDMTSIIFSSWALSYALALETAGYIYDSENSYYISPDLVYYVAFRDGINNWGTCDIFIYPYTPPLPLAFPYSAIENILGVTINGLIPNIFDDTILYDLYNGTPLDFNTVVRRFIDISDGPLDHEATIAVYEAGLVDNGFTLYVVTTMYEESLNIYSITIDSVILYVGIHYYTSDECYTIAFWVVPVEENPVPGHEWEELLAALEQITLIDLSTLPNIHWPNAILYGATEGLADIELIGMDPFIFETWLETYTQTLILAGFIYDEVYEWYISPDNNYTLTFYDSGDILLESTF